jgi:hypothetical protein
MFAWPAMSGSLNPSSCRPLAFALFSSASVTLAAPQIMGTNSALLWIPRRSEAQV